MKTNSILRKTVFILLTAVSFSAGLSAAADANEQQEKYLREAKIRKNTASSFVVLHYHFKKSQRPKPPEDDYNYDEQAVLEKILAKQTLDTAGVIISKDGEVFTAENYSRPEVIDKITVTGPDGQTLNAVQEKILTKTSGQIIRITGAMPESWKPLNFAEAPAVLDIKTKLYGISLCLGTNIMPYMGSPTGQEGEEYFQIRGAYPVRKRNNQSDVPDYFNIAGNCQPTVICDANGFVLGVTDQDRIETGNDALVWRGSDIPADSGIKRQQGEEKIKELFSKYLYQVRITLRPPPKEDDEYDMGMYGAFWQYGGRGGEEGKEMFTYGLAVAADKLLTPAAMTQEIVAGIDTISVEVGGKYFEANFAGVLKEMDGTVIQLNEAKLPDVLNIEQEVNLPRGEPFWAVFARELAGKDLVIDYNRWLHKKQGYENKLYRQVENNIRDGSWLLDKQGRFAGLYTSERREYQRLLPYLMGTDTDSFNSGIFSAGQIIRRFTGLQNFHVQPDNENTRIFDAAELVAVMKDLPAHYDSHIRLLSREEQKRRVWLGVEFTGVSKEMAKQLNLRSQTQDGRIGLMVNRIYAGSLAAKMGLAEGDILLKLKLPAAPWPIELKFRRDSDFERPDFENVDIPQEFEAMGISMPRKRPWPSRDNFFTSMLKVIGEGTTVELTYVHDGNELHKEFVIEQSPPDSLSAKKFKDKKLGITAKNLTYEVRSALKLSENEKAIVVSKVEPGTPAALARINAFELIRAVDGQEISSVDELESVIKKAHEEGRNSVRITVEWMGKTRLADLKFEAKAEEKIKNMMRLLPGIAGSDNNAVPENHPAD